MEFKSSEEIRSCGHSIQSDDYIFFPIPKNDGTVEELRLRVGSYRPRCSVAGQKDDEVVTAICDAAGITPVELVELAEVYYPVDSYDKIHIGDRWPERQTDHSNKPSEMTALILDVMERIEARMRKPKGRGTKVKTASTTVKPGGLVITGVIFGFGVPNLDINVR